MGLKNDTQRTKVVKSANSIDLKANARKRRISGHAAMFNNVDFDGDITRPGAFQWQIDEGKTEHVKTLAQHQVWVPIGKPDKLYEDESGLYFESPISKTQAGDEMLTLIEDGVVSEMSFGFDILGYEENTDGLEYRGRPVRDLTKLYLWEISPVTWGANSQTDVALAKALGVPVIPGQEVIDDITDGRGEKMWPWVLTPNGTWRPKTIDELYGETKTPMVVVPEDVKKGAVLSAANKKALSDAAEAMETAAAKIKNVLKSADKEEDEPDKGKAFVPPVSDYKEIMDALKGETEGAN